MFGVEAYAAENMVYLFFCVFILVGLYLWSHHWKARKMDAFAHMASMKKIADSVSAPKRALKRALMCAVYLLLVFALMRPQGNPDQELENGAPKEDAKTVSASLSLEEIEKGDDGEKGKKVTVRESARDIILLLDVSASMGAEDLYPNRLRKAKEIIRDIVSALDGEHVGLVVFTSTPSVKCILTLDYTYFKGVLELVTINDNDFAGTRFTPALEEIFDRQFDFSENKHKELIIITDGGDTDLEGLEGEDKTAFENNIHALVRQAHEENDIRVHVIGLGTPGGAIIHGVKDRHGNPVRSGLNEPFLKAISQNGEGVYVSVKDANVDMKTIYRENIAVGGADDLEKEKEITVDPDKLKELVRKQKEREEQKVVYEEFYIYPLALGLLLLLVEFFLTDRKKRQGPKEASP
ncbi:MAG: VWA domain-containing protein [Desulfobacterales bacterium]|nr:VWA domain-containing protein [Desulfobacterales bacterium]